MLPPHTHSLYMVAASAGRWKMKPVTRLEIIFRCAIIEALKALRQRKGIKTNDDSLYFAGIFLSVHSIVQKLRRISNQLKMYVEK